VSVLQRNVGAAQRLGQPRNLDAGIVLRRIETPFRQGLADSATNRRYARLGVSRDLLDAVARHEQVEISLSAPDREVTEDLAGGALAGPFGGRFELIGHERLRSANKSDYIYDSVFSARKCFRAPNSGAP